MQPVQIRGYKNDSLQGKQPVVALPLVADVNGIAEAVTKIITTATSTEKTRFLIAQTAPLHKLKLFGINYNIFWLTSQS